MWLYHLRLSPYCHAHYAVVCDNKGRDVCECGWTDPTHFTEKRSLPKGKTFSQILAGVAKNHANGF